MFWLRTERSEVRILPGAPYNKKSLTSFWWGFFIVRCLEGLVRHTVRKNRWERFLTSAIFADGPEGVRAGKPE